MRPDPVSFDLVAPAAEADLAVAQRTLPELVADAIVQGIGAGRLKPGERLYEPNLCERLRVSRAPIREALRILQVQGIVEGEPQRGLSVCLFDEKRRAEVYEIRHALERISIPKAAARLRAEPEAAQSLKQLIVEMDAIAARGDRLAMNKLDLAFHGEICRIAGNEVLMNLWRGLARQVLIILALETTSKLLLPAIRDQHVSLLATMHSGTQKELEKEITSHIAEPWSDGWPGTGSKKTSATRPTRGGRKPKSTIEQKGGFHA
ncbi:MAG: GntR family transcriptional regulator [Bauldia sp.]|nr:GntR family transcriptional regulator [Bauldia sp.]